MVEDMCARLGVRIIYNQVYRPQSNGRAEVACKTLEDGLHKLRAEVFTNWVETLPRFLRVYHNTPGQNGMSPFNILFGRDRYEASAPYESRRGSKILCKVLRECKYLTTNG